MQQDQEIIEKYEKMSRGDDAGYSPLMCAAFDEDIQGVKFLLKQARRNGNLKEVLGFTNTVEVTGRPEATGENILFIKKNKEIFELCCNAALECGLLKQLLNTRDKDNDNILHQTVEFGRIHVIKILAEISQSHPDIKDVLVELSEQKNKDGHRPIDITENFDQSTVVTELRNKKELNYQYENSKNMLPDIRLALEEVMHRTTLKL